MVAKSERQVVTELARAAVERAAPDELPQFALTAESFFAAPQQSRRRGQRDEPLGLGLESVEVLASTVAFNVAVEVVKHLAAKYSERAAGALGGRLLAAIRRRRGVPPTLPSTFDDGQLAEIHAVAQRKASALGLAEEQAELIADGIVHGLTTVRAITADAASPNIADFATGSGSSAADSTVDD